MYTHDILVGMYVYTITAEVMYRGEREGGEGGREGGRDGGREGGREGEREGGMEGGREGGRERERGREGEGEREGGREGISFPNYMYIRTSVYQYLFTCENRTHSHYLVCTTKCIYTCTTKFK